MVLFFAVILIRTNKLPLESSTEGGYAGYFVDNLNDEVFFIDFASEKIDIDGSPKKEIVDLFKFVDEQIRWNVTYDL